MDIQIMEQINGSLQVIIKCRQIDEDIIRLKSQIVNIQKITSLKPELNRTILATMCNGEQLSISRKYVKALRNLLSV